ncbi:MAG: AAA family ATPase [Magnetococcales bacterium]|nr:AAA family ATPase [Magnetococcales bacterium]NGZ26457.1 AAA family ATPase [Magnetococcales bacterium]
MVKNLKLYNFKSHQESLLELGNFSLLVGTNAAGKSNIGDALRFLHGIGRGYYFSDIFSGKWGEGGYREWEGVRGGTHLSFNTGNSFVIHIGFDDCSYDIGVYTEFVHPFVFLEYLMQKEIIPFILVPDENRQYGNISPVMLANIRFGSSLSQKDIEINKLMKGENYSILQGIVANSSLDIDCPRDQPLLNHLQYRAEVPEDIKDHCRKVQNYLKQIRFLDLHPKAMRQPSVPGVTVLGHQGENLSSVIYAICQDKEQKETLLSWLHELTPMDVQDVDFVSLPDGKILLELMESNGQKISIYNTSDGTLRFLGLLALLLGGDPARLIFIEELDTGIHPTRLWLLVDMIERLTAASGKQILATTHSPYLLACLSPQAREYASLVYRLPGSPESRITRVMDIPHIREVLEQQDLATLMASGWLEDVVALQQENRP